MLFFAQAEVNNAHCRDRAAMALNEVYTAWKILCPSVEEMSVREKLEMLVGVAKTHRLRKELQLLIPSHERESVEIYLFYESKLRTELV